METTSYTMGVNVQTSILTPSTKNAPRLVSLLEKCLEFLITL